MMLAIALIGILAFAVLCMVMAVAESSPEAMYGAWKPRAFCKCGRHQDVPFNEMWFVHNRNGGTCPSCGESARKLVKRVCRWKNGAWEYREDADNPDSFCGTNEPGYGE